MKFEDLKPGMVLLEEIKEPIRDQMQNVYTIILIKQNLDLVRLIEVFEVSDKWLCKLRTVYKENWHTKGWWRGRRVHRKMLFNSLFRG